jgi:hypothetical protein
MDPNPIEAEPQDKREKFKSLAIKLTPDKFSGAEDQSYADFRESVYDAVGTLGIQDDFEAGLLEDWQGEVVFYMLRRALGEEAKEEIADVPTGDYEGLMTALDQRYDPMRTRNKLTHLRTLLVGGCSSVEELPKWLKHKRQAYNKIKKVKYSAEDLLCLGVCDGLPEELKNLGDIALARDNLKFAELKNLLDDKISDRGDDKAKAYKTGGNVQCVWCGNMGHWASECRKRINATGGAGGSTNNNKKSNPNAKAKNQKKKKCYICDSVDHLADACPKGKKGKKARAKLAKVLLAGVDGESASEE